MKSPNFLLILLPLLLLGCKAKPEPLAVKMTPYQFLDNPYRESSDDMARKSPEMRDFYAGTVVSAGGTWNSKTKLAFPMQTVDIHCIKSEGMVPWAHDGDFHSFGLCIVAKATIDTEGKFGQENFLSANTNFYDITKWDYDEIVSDSGDSPVSCFKEELKLDRKNRQVTLLRITLAGRDPELCGYADKEPVLLTLGCPPAPWPLKNDGTLTCIPDVENMTQEQKDAYLNEL